jgi:hypothetical protein
VVTSCSCKERFFSLETSQAIGTTTADSIAGPTTTVITRSTFQQGSIFATATANATRKAARSTLPDCEDAHQEKEGHGTAVKNRGHLVKHGAEGAFWTQEAQI